MLGASRCTSRAGGERVCRRLYTSVVRRHARIARASAAPPPRAAAIGDRVVSFPGQYRRPGVDDSGSRPATEDRLGLLSDRPVAGLGRRLVAAQGPRPRRSSHFGGDVGVLLPCRRHFYRKGVLLTERFTLRWCIAIALVLVCAVWLAGFAYAQVEYSDELWWRFALDQDAPRSLRPSRAPY